MNFTQRISLALLAAYKRWISPANSPGCRFLPSCSDYTAEAIARYGTLRGITLGVCRLLRCHPFSKGGYDPVPIHDSCVHAHPSQTVTQEIKGQPIA